MAKHLDKFNKPFENSSLPYLLLEVLTDGEGQLSDLKFLYLNEAAGKLWGLAPEGLTGKRFTKRFPGRSLAPFAPAQAVAFSGSTAVLSCPGPKGESLRLHCSQPMYGLVSCILEPPAPAQSPAERAALLEHLPGAALVLELGRGGLRPLEWSRALGQLCGREDAALSALAGEEFSRLIEPEDRPALLQALLDCARSGEPADLGIRLMLEGGGSRYVSLRAELMEKTADCSLFCALLLDEDGRERQRAREAAAHQEAQEAWGQLRHCMEALPLGGAILSRRGEGWEALRLSRGLSELLGEGPEALRRHILEEPLWRVPQEERQALMDAAKEARRKGAPLRRRCPLLAEEGAPARWLLIEAVWQPQEDGRELLFVACSDVSEEQSLLSQLEFYTRLSELLLRDTRLVTFDYDPATDLCRIFRLNKEGRRRARSIPHYLEDLVGSPVIFEEDKALLSQAVREAAKKPGTEAVEYRADYDGCGWRWYRLSWQSLFDRRGDVYRLIGRAEDITAQKARSQRFWKLCREQKELPAGLMASAQLDLRKNRILDARGAGGELLQKLFGNTAEEWLDSLAALLPEPTEQAIFRERFSRPSLLDAFHRGEGQRSLSHGFAPQAGQSLRVRTEAELLPEPESGSATLFLKVWEEAPQGILPRLLALDYRFLCTLEEGGRVFLPGESEPRRYEDMARQYEAHYRETAPTLEALWGEFSKRGALEQRLPDGDRVLWSWLDPQKSSALLRCRK